MILLSFSIYKGKTPLILSFLAKAQTHSINCRGFKPPANKEIKNGFSQIY